MEEENSKKLLSPKLDVVFQVLFGEVGSEEITKSFLEDILGEEIYKIDLSRNPILRRMNLNDKMGILDVIAQINENEYCNIEMQITQRDDIIQRMLYYWARTFTRNIKKGEEYDNLNRTIVILIADFELKELQGLDYFTKWKIIDENGRKVILTHDLELDIIELPKIYKLNEERNDKLLDWLYFLENPESKKVEKIMSNNEEIQKANEKLEEISNDEIMQRIAEWRESAAHDEASARLTATRIGREEGMKEGIKQGMKQGAEEEKKKIAKNMKDEKINIELIEKITGLTKDEIENL